MNNARGEVSQYQIFDYLVVNDDLEEAVRKISAIFAAQKCRRERCSQMAENLLREG